MARSRFRTLSMLFRRGRREALAPQIRTFEWPQRRPAPTTMRVYLERAGIDPVKIGTCRICYTPSDRDIAVRTHRPIPVQGEHSVGEVWHVRFPIRQIVDGRDGTSRPSPAIMVREGDDPSILPEWSPAPRTEVTAFHRRGRYHVRMRAVSPAEFADLPPREPGLPQCWMRTPTGAIETWPAPSGDYEVHTQVWPPSDRATEEMRRAAAARYDTLAMNALLGGGTTNAAPEPRSLTMDDILRTCDQAAAMRLQAEALQTHQMRRAEDQRLAAMRAMQAAALNPFQPPHQGLQQLWQANPVLFTATEVFRTMGLPGAFFGVDLARQYPRVDGEIAARSRERARSLLKSLLTPEQWAEFEVTDIVRERIGECEFVLRPGGQMIQALKPRTLRGPIRERWCISPDPYADGNDWMPDEDKLIGQLLHLRAGPDKLRAAANVFSG